MARGDIQNNSYTSLSAEGGTTTLQPGSGDEWQLMFALNTQDQMAIIGYDGSNQTGDLRGGIYGGLTATADRDLSLRGARPLCVSLTNSQYCLIINQDANVALVVWSALESK